MCSRRAAQSWTFNWVLFIWVYIHQYIHIQYVCAIHHYILGVPQGQGHKESWGTDSGTYVFSRAPELDLQPCCPPVAPVMKDVMKQTSNMSQKSFKIVSASVLRPKQPTSSWIYYLRYQTHFLSSRHLCFVGSRPFATLAERAHIQPPHRAKKTCVFSWFLTLSRVQICLRNSTESAFEHLWTVAEPKGRHSVLKKRAWRPIDIRQLPKGPSEAPKAVQYELFTKAFSRASWPPSIWMYACMNVCLYVP